MANRLLSSLAIKIGAGLATGFQAASQTRPQAPNFTPILTRIEDIESRVTRVELQPAPVSEEIEALGTMVSSQTEDIAGLRQAIGRIENQNAERAEAFEQKVAVVEKQVPAFIEAAVNARMVELEQKLRGEFQEIHIKTVDAFAEAIENRVVGRIAALENSLVEQSQSIGSLREKSAKTDDHLQRLLEAVEKLCVRAEAQTQIPAPVEPHKAVERPMAAEPQKASVPQKAETFESHYRWAIAREDARRESRDSAAAHRINVEPEPELAFAGAGHSSSSSRRGMKAVGFAILGLAVLGLRFAR